MKKKLDKISTNRNIGDSNPCARKCHVGCVQLAGVKGGGCGGTGVREGEVERGEGEMLGERTRCVEDGGKVRGG